MLLIELALVASFSTTGGVDLVAAAAASGRPAECLPESRAGRRSTVWSTARMPGRRLYCRLVALAHARLLRDPLAARAAALQADEVLPGRAAPHVVLARSALRLGDLPKALEHFATARTRGPRSIEQPAAMHDHATTLWRSGKLTEALTVHRALVPRASLLPKRLDRAQVLLEAAHVSMAVAGGKSTPPSLDEALAFLREAARDPHHALRIDVGLSLVLVLDRAGNAAEADALLTSLRNTAGWAKSLAKPEYLVEEADHVALRAVALERADAPAALALWREYLAAASSNHPWTRAAAERVRRLEGQPRRPVGRGHR